MSEPGAPSRRPLGAILAAAALIAAGCAGAGSATAPAGGAGGSGGPLVIAGGDAPADARRIAAAAREAQVVYLGEQHDNAAHHARQRLLVEALSDGGPPLAVGFEMLPETRQDAVDAVLAAGPDAATLGRALGWRESGWPDFAMYWPLFELAIRGRWPVLALDLDPALTRRIARGGLGAAGPEADRVASRLPPDPAREAAIARTMVDAHCGHLPADRAAHMVDAWHARNVTMARRIAAAVDSGRRVVVIVGRGHQAPGGLPAQLAAVRPGTRQFVVDLVEVAPGGGAEAQRSTADAVWLTPGVKRSDPCAPPRGSGGDVIPSGSP